MKFEQAIIDSLKAMDGRRSAMLKEFKRKMRENGYSGNDLDLLNEFDATINSLIERKTIKLLPYAEMNEHQKFISDSEGEPLYVLI